jgi:hypothetical protein
MKLTKEESRKELVRRLEGLRTSVPCPLTIRVVSGTAAKPFANEFSSTELTEIPKSWCKSYRPYIVYCVFSPKRGYRFAIVSGASIVDLKDASWAKVPNAFEANDIDSVIEWLRVNN